MTRAAGPPSRRAALAAFILALALTPAIAAAQDDARLLDALRIAQEGGSDSARKLVSGLLQATPPTDSVYPQMLFTMGLVSRNVEEMRRNYTRVAVEYALSPWADDALYRLALLDYAAGNVTGAARQLDRIRSDYPDSPILPVAAEWAARAFFDQKKLPEGCSWLAYGISRAGEDVELKNRLEYMNGRCSAQPPVGAAPVDTTPKPPPNNPPPPAPAGYGVQVGAVNTQASADKLASNLKGAGFVPYIVKEGTLFKVRAGPYPDRAKAVAAAEQIRRKLGHSPFVVKEP
ncbi:MAG TPA: SPOR domain-containing protein [Gemmatimonadales bacterium]|jgi:tetratricopeptide (TPR) repeat protein